MERQRLLRHLGISQNRGAYFRCLTALEVIRANPEALTLVTKELYPEVAKHHFVSWKAVEIDFRRVTARTWRENAQRLNELNGCPLTGKPSTAQFLAILAANAD